MRVLAPVKELGDGWVGLRATWDLLRMNVGNTVLVNWDRGDVMGKLMASWWGSRSGGLAGFYHVDSDSAGDFLHVFKRACVVEVVITVVLHVLLILVLSRRYNNLNFTTEHQVEAVAAGGLLETGEARSIAPLVQFPTKGIGFDLDHAEFTGGNEPVTAGSVDVGNRGVDDSRLGGATNLRQIRQKTGEIQETTIEGLTPLSLDGVVGGPSLGGVRSPAGLSLSSRGRGDHDRVGISVRIREGLGNLRGRQGRGRVGGGRSGSTVRGTRRDLKRHCHREQLRWRVVEGGNWWG
jgi:hypothetical protein